MMMLRSSKGREDRPVEADLGEIEVEESAPAGAIFPMARIDPHVRVAGLIVDYGQTVSCWNLN